MSSGCSQSLEFVRSSVTKEVWSQAPSFVLLFLVPPNAGAGGVALKDLVAFDRVHVPVNATVSVALSVPLKVFATKGAYTVEAGVRGDSRVGFAAATVFVRGGGVV